VALDGNQYERLRDGDRLFYTNDALLWTDEVRQIIDLEQLTLAQVIKRNTGIVNLQDNVFFDRSVLVFEAPAEGANVTLAAGLGVVSLVDTRTGELLALRSLAGVSQVILVGSNTSNDVFNLFIASANGAIEHGVIVYGRGGDDDRINVFGRALKHDAFNVTADTATVNGNGIKHSGLELIRIVTLGGNDSVTIAPGLENVIVLAWFDFLAEARED
jgi:hypothetical protein